MKKLTKSQLEERIKLLESSTKFPQLPREQKKSCKLDDKDIEDIRYLRNIGVNLKEIAQIYNITVWTVHYWTNENVRNGAKKRGIIYIKKKYNSNAEFRKKTIKNSYSYMKNRLNNKDVELRKYVRARVLIGFYKHRLKSIS